MVVVVYRDGLDIEMLVGSEFRLWPSKQERGFARRKQLAKVALCSFTHSYLTICCRFVSLVVSACAGCLFASRIRLLSRAKPILFVFVVLSSAIIRFSIDNNNPVGLLMSDSS